ncbi:Pimeloyl-ACP methyl ester carboxylesterase [Filimonas lacunae]|uniref:Pimeloyl-ACP methyl ester carboxylesterase n=1 Tax=Filimonas lacunae TaxID=477680 RepID=A0A173MGP3_9BACT|nr:alpha/beta fold hydrolase [Filimonas lacunae]BAV06773.1 salicylate esterase [Filimonas lacunae]SIT34385.1 Pimeloyl-ACP methyl ester carboxylesterase [Filimonas lacunae]
MKKVIFILAMTVSAFTTQAQKVVSKHSKTIVLVHGAWSDSSSWNAVTPILRAQGEEVININLAGHGKDTTAFAGISFQTYVNQVKAAIGNRTAVVLAGHSFAGLVISQVAEEIPSQVKELVFLAAALPNDGASLLSLAKQDPASHIGKALTIDKEHGAAIVTKEAAADIFAADAPQQVQEYIAANLKPEPLAPLATPVHLTDKNFGSIRKVYIHTVNDNAISYAAQQYMAKAGKVAKVYSLPSSHTPFISMPDKLAAILITESK